MRRYLVAITIGSLSSIFALPSGGEVVRGDAAIVLRSDSSLLNVEASGRTVIQWESFNIASQETVAFSQRFKGSPILNQVTHGEASQIFGRLTADCPIYLINPQGIFVGNAAAIETAGFLASTADISHDAFINGKEISFSLLQEGSIVNLGSIQAHEGDVVFIARVIDNQGIVDAPQGAVTFTTTEMMIRPSTKETIFIRSEEEIEPQGMIGNSGHIKALSVELHTHSPYEKAIRQTGTIEASALKTDNGRIYLIADRGSCDVDSLLTAPGGEIQITAQKIAVQKDASLDVSSDAGAGSIAIGCAEGLKAESVSIASGASLLANAKVDGDGGHIAVYAENEMDFLGIAEVRGGSSQGNGGLVQISSRGSLKLAEGSPIADATASHGQTGRVVIDPKYVTISSNGIDPATGNTFASDASGNVIISGSTLQAALDSANVTIQANTDITFSDAVTATTIGNALTLQAGRSIGFYGQLSLNGGDFSATINDAGAVPEDRDSGFAQFQMSSVDLLSQIETQGGDLTIDVGSFGSVTEGAIAIVSGELNAGGGDLSLTGVGRQVGGNYSSGIMIGSEAMISTSGDGAISMTGTGGNGATGNCGIAISGELNLIQVDEGDLVLTGQGGGNGTSSLNNGISVNGHIASIGGGQIILNGTGGSGTDFNMGVYLTGSGTQVSTTDGNISIEGIGAGTGNLNFGVRFEPEIVCSSTGSGTISISGTSGMGVDNNHGVIFSGGSVNSQTGNITVIGTGQGSGEYNYGVRFESDAFMVSNGLATISIEGESLSSGDAEIGVSFSGSADIITSSYGDISIAGTSQGEGLLNQGVRLESGRIVSTGTGEGAANITITGIGGTGTNFCNGVSIQGDLVEVTSVDGNITINGTSTANGVGNDPVLVDPPEAVNTTGTGMVTID